MKHFTPVIPFTLLACGAILQGQIYTPPAPTQLSSSPLLKKVGIDQKMGAQVPLDLAFNDESGQLITLRQYLGKPVILALVYYQCPSLCNMVLNGLVRSVKGLTLTAGEDYEVVAVSFDPRETPEMARAKKQTYMKEYNRPGTEESWHFLTGDEAASKALADSVGFHFVYDTMTNQYAHGSGIIMLTPEGRTTRYFFGIDYPARDVKLGLVEASNNRIGSAIDQVELYCFHYDPANGKYGLVIMNVLRLGGLLTLGLLAGFMISMFRRDFRARHPATNEGGRGMTV
jgi:protein SCO1/2